MHIPKELKAINAGAFDYNDIVEFQVTDGNKYFNTLEGVLFNANYTKLIQCPQNKKGVFRIPNPVRQIVKSAFSCCELDEVFIPSSIGKTLPCFFEFSRIKKVVIQECLMVVRS